MRTKQTAKKSTGSVAPHAVLPIKSSGNGPSLRTRGSSVRNGVTVKGKRGKKNVAVDDAEPVAKDSATMSESIAGDEHDDYCSGCINGGEPLMLCDSCKRVTCQDCVKTLAPSDASRYICPACHVSKDRMKGQHTPYYGVYTEENKPLNDTFCHVSPLGSRSLFPRVNTESTLILSIRLQGLQLVGDPASVTHTYLGPAYWPVPGEQSLTHKVVTYNFDDESGLRAYREEMQSVIEFVKQRRITRFIVFFEAHSTPDTGLIHFTAGFSTDVHALISIIFLADLCAILQRGRSTLFWLICGGPFAKEVSLQAIRDFGQRGIFNEMVAFPTLNLQPHYTSVFCMKFVELIYIESQSLDRVVPNLLQDNPRLGAHAEVWVFVLGNIQRYVWFHRVTKPNGLHPRRQCSKCGVIGQLHVKIEKACVTWRCLGDQAGNRACGHVMKEEIPMELRDLGESGSGQGTWKVVTK